MSDIHTKLAAIAGQIGPINKDERNKEQGFNFRSIEQITAAVRPLFAKESVSVAPQVIKLEHSEVTAKSGARGFRAVVHMAYIFTAGSDGSFVETSMVGEAVDYGDKSTSKAVQMAYKYALTQVLQVGSGEADPDSQSVDVGHAEAKPKQQRSARQKAQTATTSADDLEVKKWATKQKLALVDLVGDTEKAKEIWRDVLSTYGLEPDDLPDKRSLDFIEADLVLAAKESEQLEVVQPELAPEDERPFE